MATQPSPPPFPLPSQAEVSGWAISGSYFEVCNCDPVCPCRSVGGRPRGHTTYGVCLFALSWHIVAGHADEVDLSGRDVVMAGFYADDEPRSPWQVILYIDDRASAEQHDWLSRIFLGKAGGGTLTNFARGISTVYGVRSAAIALRHEDGAWSIAVEGHIRAEATEAVDLDETVACDIAGLDRPGLELIASQLVVTDTPLEWDLHGRCGFAGDFAYCSH